MNGYRPPRFSPKSVYRFVSVLQRVADQLEPKPIKFDPKTVGLSLETAIARLRDAKSALATGLLTHPNVNADRLKAMWPKYRISTEGAMIVLCPRTTEQEPTVTAMIGDVGNVIGSLQADEQRFADYLHAFATLLGGRKFQGAVTITGTLSAELVNQITSKYDVVIQENEPNQYIML